MLVAIRTTGSRPPLFVMHGASGICDGALPVEGLSADQPIYGVEARGIDGAAAPLASVEEMCSAYADEVVAAQPTGPYLFAGVGRGAIAAVEVARELETRGMTVGSVFMLDPGLAPHHTPRALARIEAGLKNPAVGRQLFEHARNSLPALVRNSPRRPFDPGQPAQIEAAANVAVSTSLAFARHVLTPYYGDVELVLSADRAPVFFDPKHAWQATLLGRRALHALEGQAETLLTLHRATVAQLLDVYLDFAYAPTDGGAATP